MQVRKDGQASRTQLQLAVKAQPSLVQRYFIFAVRVAALHRGRAGGPRGPQVPAVACASMRSQGEGGRAASGCTKQCRALPPACPCHLSAQTQDMTKRLKDESSGLDLNGYVEFQRNYRACVRAHKMALSAQRTFWMALLHDTVHFKSLQRSFRTMNKVGGAQRLSRQRVSPKPSVDEGRQSHMLAGRRPGGATMHAGATQAGRDTHALPPP